MPTSFPRNSSHRCRSVPAVMRSSLPHCHRAMLTEPTESARFSPPPFIPESPSRKPQKEQCLRAGFHPRRYADTWFPGHVGNMLNALAALRLRSGQQRAVGIRRIPGGWSRLRRRRRDCYHRKALVGARGIEPPFSPWVALTSKEWLTPRHTRSRRVLPYRAGLSRLPSVGLFIQRHCTERGRSGAAWRNRTDTSGSKGKAPGLLHNAPKPERIRAGFGSAALESKGFRRAGRACQRQ